MLYNNQLLSIKIEWQLLKILIITKCIFEACENNPVDRRDFENEFSLKREKTNFVKKEIEKPPKLGLTHLKYVFLILIFGQSLALLAFFAETVIDKINKKVKVGNSYITSDRC